MYCAANTGIQNVFVYSGLQDSGPWIWLQPFRESYEKEPRFLSRGVEGLIKIGFQIFYPFNTDGEADGIRRGASGDLLLW
jgi:hypothetical protein